MLTIVVICLCAKKRQWFLLGLFLLEVAYEVVVLCMLLPSMHASAVLLGVLREILFCALIAAIFSFILLRDRRKT